MKFLKESVLLGVLCGVLLSQVACGGIDAPEAPCTDNEGVQYDCIITGICNECLNPGPPRYCFNPDDGNCCVPDPAG